MTFSSFSTGVDLQERKIDCAYFLEITQAGGHGKGRKRGSPPLHAVREINKTELTETWVYLL